MRTTTPSMLSKTMVLWRQLCESGCSPCPHTRVFTCCALAGLLGFTLLSVFLIRRCFGGFGGVLLECSANCHFVSSVVSSCSPPLQSTHVNTLAWSTLFDGKFGSFFSLHSTEAFFWFARLHCAEDPCRISCLHLQFPTEYPRTSTSQEKEARDRKKNESGKRKGTSQDKEKARVGKRKGTSQEKERHTSGRKARVRKNKRRRVRRNKRHESGKNPRVRRETTSPAK